MKTLFASVIFTGLGLAAFAQQPANTNQQKLIAQMPEYVSAQNELSHLSVQWMKEIESKYSEVSRLVMAYQADEPSLTKEMKQKRQDEIVQKRQEAENLQRQRFGINGDLSKKRMQLLKPLEEKIK